MSVSINDVRKHVEAVVASKCSNATPGQRATIVAKIMSSNTVQNSELRGLMLSPLGAEHDVEQLLRTDPSLIAEPPSVADILAAKIAEREAVTGAPVAPDMRLEWHRELMRMSADERLATGVKPGATQAPEQQAPASDKTLALHQLDDGDDAFDALIKKRLGIDPATLTASRRRDFVRALKQESQPKQVDADRISAEAISNVEQLGRQPSAAERLTQFRLAQKAK